MDLYGRNITEIKDHSRIIGRSSRSKINQGSSKDLRDKRSIKDFRKMK